MKNITLLQNSVLITMILLSIVSLLVLPENVAVQWNSGGASSYIPKIYAVLIPVAISLFGVFSWKYSSIRYKNNVISENFQKIHSVIWGTVSCTGIFMNVMFMIMNGKPVIL